MKIAFLLCSRFWGGVEAVASAEANSVATKNGFEVLFIVPKGCEFLAKISERVKIYEYESFDKRFNPFLYIEIYKILKQFGADILHAHAAKATQIGFILDKFLPRTTLIATKHNARKAPIFNKIANVIAISKECANSINNPKNPAKIIYFGIDKVATELIKRAPNAPFSIVAIGRLDKIKGFDILIKEAAKLDFSFQLKIAGDGDEKSSLQALINELGLNDKISLAGFIKDIPNLIANADLLIISSIKEGLPLTLIEGIFYAKTLISTPAGSGISEILHSDFITPHDQIAFKITQIKASQEQFKKRFFAAHAQIKSRLTLQNHINELIAFYQQGSIHAAS